VLLHAPSPGSTELCSQEIIAQEMHNRCRQSGGVGRRHGQSRLPVARDEGNARGLDVRVDDRLERWLPTADRPGVPAAGYPSPQADAIDRSVLGAWLGDDAAAIASLLQKFASTAAETEREIAAAVGSGDLAAAAAAARKLNGAARTVGAPRVADIAAIVEQAGDRAGCSDALGPLAAGLRRVRAAM
jgi:HPt (histidine-containing phosphotransfer) domain-containing protein